MNPTQSCSSSFLFFSVFLMSLCFNRAPRHEGVLGEWRYSSAPDGSEWSASRPCRFTQKEIVPGTLWIGGWVGPKTGLDAMVKRKIPSPRRESNPRTPIVQHVAQRYTDWTITALFLMEHFHHSSSALNFVGPLARYGAMLTFEV
jgi:hypothetical protein